MTGKSMDPPTLNIAEFVSDLSDAVLKPELLRLVERAFIDTIGVTFAGADQPVTRKIKASVSDSNRGVGANLFGVSDTSLLDSVLISGTAGHALDFDDVSWGMDGHPSVTLVPPILAIGQREDSTGQEMIEAYIAGFETECYLATPISPEHYEAGWHATSTLGTFGAAAAVSTLLDHSEQETIHALNIAASMAAGLKQNFGSMTKPLHVGQAARSGTLAALLAGEGFTADEDPFTGSGGFFELYGGDAEYAGNSLWPLGEQWALEEHGIHVKQYPCCYFAHTSIAATLAITRATDLTPDDLQAIRVSASQGAADALKHDEPKTGLEAKFSMPFTVAQAVVHESVDLSTFEEPRLSDYTVSKLMEKVSLTVDDELEYDSHQATVELETSGESFEETVEDAPGAHSNPLSEEALRDKFDMCTKNAIEDVADRQESWGYLDELRHKPSIRTLAQRFDTR